MGINLMELENTALLVLAAETDDEIGTVLRMHLAVEKFLVWYVDLRRTGEMGSYVKEPREFGGRLALAAAFGLPLPFVRVLYQINVIRNKTAHGAQVLSADQVKELARQVNRLTEFDGLFPPLNKRYVEFALKQPGVQHRFGQGDLRVDFFIATFSFYAYVICWAKTQVNAVEKNPLTELTEISLILHESIFIEFITERGVGRNDVVASSPASYISYLKSTAKLIGREITPELLRSENDVLRIANSLSGKREERTIRNYCSAMRQYVAMVEAKGL